MHKRHYWHYCRLFKLLKLQLKLTCLKDCEDTKSEQKHWLHVDFAYHSWTRSTVPSDSQTTRRKQLDQNNIWYVLEIAWRRFKSPLYESRKGSSDFRLPNCARLPLLNTDWMRMRRCVEFCVLITFLYLGIFDIYSDCRLGFKATVRNSMFSYTGHSLILSLAKRYLIRDFWKIIQHRQKTKLDGFKLRSCRKVIDLDVTTRDYVN